jgi:ABC-type thiamine transport system substrate-binding protein
MTLEEMMQLHPALAEAFQTEAMVQVVYVTLEDGRKLVFLGPPMDAEEVAGVQEVTFGEHVHAALLHHVSQKHQRLTVQ